ncbi:DUF488 family protein [Bacillus sp. K6W]|uniref:DUF488 family protein, N3 subclade n=1 Tax=Bacillus sp. K6W TaxID=2249215 RepID=UPI000DF78BAE|nr:DUF488 family protein [Bacillus sp. K6W]
MNQPKGRLYTSNPAGLRFLKEEAEIWQITRGGITIPNTILVRGLSPSPKLFQNFIQDWKDKPYDEWWNLYEKRFLVEMESDEKIRGLRDVYKKLLIGKNVVLVCFCKDHRYCHRRLVGEFFRPYGVEAIELNPITQDQLSLF